MNKCIITSVFDIFKPGPGPSSSHTTGPMKAAADFVRQVNLLSENERNSATGIKVFLYGSLSSTGHGHGTHLAVAAGLLGQLPENCDTEFMQNLFADKQQTYNVNSFGRNVTLRETDIQFMNGEHSFPYQNALVFKLNSLKNVILEKTYYSIGGGFIICEGEPLPPTVVPPYRYRNMTGFRQLVAKYNMNPAAILLENEIKISGMTEAEVFEKIDSLLELMKQTVSRGIETEGILPGTIRLQRKATAFYKRASSTNNAPDRFMALLDAFSLAAAEENAAGHIVVTAPTSGSAGVLPGIIFFLENYQRVSREKLRQGLLVAAAIGFIARHNASISGAEVGCQGEIGVASSMAAALLAYVNGYDMDVIECAAEIALEHHLGMTCDPVGGYVQIPCIERNAVGAVTAYNAYLLAALGDSKKQKVSFDEVVEAMLQTGREMSADLKETSRGGLAVCSLCC
ncbi:MAG: L-serine ammonia-lyase [Victivallaceae bacterium]